MKLHNTSNRDRAIPGDPITILHPGASMDITQEQLARLEAMPMVQGWFYQGLLTVLGGEEPETTPEPVADEGVQIRCAGGWCDVYVNGFLVTDKKVRREEAERIAAEYE